MDLVVRPNREKARNFRQMTFHPSVRATARRAAAEEEVSVLNAVFAGPEEARLPASLPDSLLEGPGDRNSSSRALPSH